MAGRLDRLFERMDARQTRESSKRRMENAFDWYRKQSLQVKDINRRAFLKRERFSRTQRPIIGTMMHFFYDPKTKDQLPYYDRFPLVIVVGPAPGGFYGLNLHYLSRTQRAKLLDQLINISKKTVGGKLNRLRLTYDLLQGTSKLRTFKPCFKHYLTGQLQSPLTRVEAEDWGKVLFLPTESFVGSKKSSVWRKSLKQL